MSSSQEIPTISSSTQPSPQQIDPVLLLPQPFPGPSWTHQARQNLLQGERVTVQLISNPSIDAEKKFKSFPDLVSKALLLHFCPSLSDDLRPGLGANPGTILELNGRNLQIDYLTITFERMRQCCEDPGVVIDMSRWRPLTGSTWVINVYHWKIMWMLRMHDYARMYRDTLLNQVRTKLLTAYDVYHLWNVLGRDSDIVRTLISTVARRASTGEGKDRDEDVIEEMKKEERMWQMYEEQKRRMDFEQTRRRLEGSDLR